MAGWLAGRLAGAAPLESRHTITQARRGGHTHTACGDRAGEPVRAARPEVIVNGAQRGTTREEWCVSRGVLFYVH